MKEFVCINLCFSSTLTIEDYSEFDSIHEHTNFILVRASCLAKRV